MLRFLRRLLGPPAPTSPKIFELVHRLDELEGAFEYLSADLKKLRGHVTGSKGGRPPAAQEAPGPTIVQPEDSDEAPPPRRAVAGTSHLARRFRGG